MANSATKTTPRPGKPVRGSKSGRPIMALFDLLGRTWALGILWQLADGPLNFRQLQTACEMVSPTVLNKRLKELKDSELLILTDDGYLLTEQGAELAGLLSPFGAWSQRWADSLPNDADEPT